MARDGYELDELISVKRVRLKCEHCDYRASLVGSAFGVIGRTEAGLLYRSFACPDCRVLFQTEDEITSYLAMLQKWTDRTPVCESCKSDDVTPWTVQKGCPKCGSAIKDTGRNVVFFD
jgi:Zn finger protein HypA/HybF involved in hydrogenase expression